MPGYINDKDILPKLQSGFRKNYCYTRALTKVIDIFIAVDSGKLTAFILLDYSRHLIASTINYYQLV